MKIEIDISTYLSESDKKEIVTNEFRRAIRESLNSGSEIENILSNAAYLSVFKETNELVENAKERILHKVNEILDDPTNYCIFRNNYLTNEPESLASKLLDEAVRNNKGLFNEKVHKVIAECSDEMIWNLFENLADTFGSMISDIATTARNKSLKN